MNSQLRNRLLIAIAAALPLSLAAQSSSSSSSEPSRASSPSAQPSSSSSTSTRSSTASTASGVAAAGNIRRLSDDASDHQFTAKDLIGKEIYDSRGKRIGEVKDVVIASSTNPQLASGLSTKEASKAAATTATTGSSTSDTTRSASDRASVSGQISRETQSMIGAASENAVIVSYGGFLGAGNSMLRVPLSQLNYDAASRHITVNVTETELSSLPVSTETTRSAAE